MAIDVDQIVNILTNTQNRYSLEEANQTLTNILESFENKPILMKDKLILEATILDFMKVYGIATDTNLGQLCLKRFSYTFLPGVSDLFPRIRKSQSITEQKTLQTVQTIKFPKILHNDENTKINEAIPIAASNISLEDELNIPKLSSTLINNVNTASTSFSEQSFPPGVTLICSLRRARSTLRTSHTYLLYLESIKYSSVPKNQATGGTPQQFPVLLLGAKRVTSSISTTSQLGVWSGADAISGEWRDKSALVRVTRSGSTYTARMAQAATSGTISSILVSVAIGNNSASNIDKDKAPVVTILATSTLTAVTSSSAVVTDGVVMDTLESLLKAAPYTPCPVNVNAGLIALRSISSVALSTALGQPNGVLNSAVTTKEAALTNVVSTAASTASSGPVTNRLPSRKNITLERIITTANAVSTGSNSSASKHSVLLPQEPSEGYEGQIFQLSKESEEIFVLEFSLLSPLQALCIALILFDR